MECTALEVYNDLYSLSISSGELFSEDMYDNFIDGHNRLKYGDDQKYMDYISYSFMKMYQRNIEFYNRVPGIEDMLESCIEHNYEILQRISAIEVYEDYGIDLENSMSIKEMNDMKEKIDDRSVKIESILRSSGYLDDTDICFMIVDFVKENNLQLDLQWGAYECVEIEVLTGYQGLFQTSADDYNNTYTLKSPQNFICPFVASKFGEDRIIVNRGNIA